MLQSGGILAQGGQVSLPGRTAELDLLQRGLQAPALCPRGISLHLQLAMLCLCCINLLCKLKAHVSAMPDDAYKRHSVIQYGRSDEHHGQREAKARCASRRTIGKCSRMADTMLLCVGMA